MKVINLVGAHGSGKGTVGAGVVRYLTSALGKVSLVQHVVIGDYLKALKKREPENGAEKQIKESVSWEELECGGSLSDQQVMTIFNYMMQKVFQQSVMPLYLVVDGVPENCAQAFQMNDLLHLWGVCDRVFVYLDVDSRTCIGRLFARTDASEDKKKMGILTRHEIWVAGEDALIRSLRQFAVVVPIRPTESMSPEEVVQVVCSEISFFTFDNPLYRRPLPSRRM